VAAGVLAAAGSTALAQHGHGGGQGGGHGGGGHPGGAAHINPGGQAHFNPGGQAHFNPGGQAHFNPGGQAHFNAGAAGSAVNRAAPGVAPQMAVPHTVGRPVITGGTADSSAAALARPSFGPATASVLGTGNFRANWYRTNPTGIQSFQNNFNSAWRARATTGAANTAAIGSLTGSPYYSNWGGSIRPNLMYGSGGYPLFNSGFWTGRNLIGLGLGGVGGYGLGGYGAGGYGLGGYGLGGIGGLGSWWGYSPWVGSQPWSYWYGNPGWGYFANSYGWNTPYYYNYGPGGNIVYQGSQVLVNGQPVGTPADYAASAAELATVSQEQMNAPHDWMPLGTFTMATSQDETNPPRVMQLAFDNKQQLISGTVFNRQSQNLYTVQGRVDPETQRVAFTIGNDPNIVMETGLYNLTQQETPLLAHFGPTQTKTYLLVRMPEPQATSQEQTTTAASPQPTAPPADELRR
jgi:hypothetical protein